MTAIDDRPAVSTHDMAAGHFKLGRVLLDIISNPKLVQPMGWGQNVWPSRLHLDGQFYNDGATLGVRREQIQSFADELGLRIRDERVQGGQIRVKAEGTYEGVELSVWGLAPAENGGAS